MKTKNYNHMYDIAFAIDTDIEDPFAVSENELLLGILKRLSTLVESKEMIVGEAIGYCDSHEDPPVFQKGEAD